MGKMPRKKIGKSIRTSSDSDCLRIGRSIGAVGVHQL
jgi:hypothetical protein